MLKALICESVNGWRELTDSFLKASFDEIERCVLYIFDDVLKKNQMLGMKKVMHPRIMNQILAETYSSVRRQVDDVFSKEMVPSTENHYFFDIITKLRSEDLLSLIEKEATDDSGKISKKAVLGIVSNCFSVGKETNEGSASRSSFYSS